MIVNFNLSALISLYIPLLMQSCPAINEDQTYSIFKLFLCVDFNLRISYLCFPEIPPTCMKNKISYFLNTALQRTELTV